MQCIYSSVRDVSLDCALLGDLSIDSHHTILFMKYDVPRIAKRWKYRLSKEHSHRCLCNQAEESAQSH